MAARFHASLLPENNLQDHKCESYDGAPKDRTVEDGDVLDLRNWRQTINHILQLRIWLRRCQVADDDGHDHANEAAPQGPEHVLRLVLRVHGERHVAHRIRIEFDPRIHAY